MAVAEEEALIVLVVVQGEGESAAGRLASASSAAKVGFHFLLPSLAERVLMAFTASYFVEGHWSSNCPNQNGGGSHNDRQGGGAGGGAGGSGTCFSCGEGALPLTSIPWLCF